MIADKPEYAKMVFTSKEINDLADSIKKDRDKQWQAAVEKLKQSIKDSDAWPNDGWLWEEIDKAFEGLMPKEKEG